MFCSEITHVCPINEIEGGMQPLYDDDDALNHVEITPTTALGKLNKSHVCTVMSPSYEHFLYVN